MGSGQARVARLVEESRACVGTAREGEWFDRLDAGRDDLDAAVLAMLAAGDIEAAVQAGAALWPYWVRRAADGDSWLARLVEATSGAAPTEELAELRYGAGLAAFRRGDAAASRALNEQVLIVAEAAGSDRARALAHIGLSRVALRDGDYAAGLRLAATADRFAGEDERLRTTALHMRAELTRAGQDYAGAVPLYERLLASDERLGDQRSVALEHYNLGSVLLQVGDLPGAEHHLTEALGLTTDHLPYALLGLAGLAARRQDTVTAGRLIGAVQAHLERVGEVLDPAEQLELASHVEAGRAAGRATYDTAYVEGRSLTLEQAERLVTGRRTGRSPWTAGKAGSTPEPGHSTRS